MKNRLFKPVWILLAAALVFSLAGCGKDSSPAQEIKTEKTPEPTAEAAQEFKYVAETLLTTQSSRKNALAAEPAFFTDDGYYAIGGHYMGEVVPEGATSEYEGQFSVTVPCLSFVAMDGTITELPGFSPAVPGTTEHEGSRDYSVNNSIEKFMPRTDGNFELVESVYVSWSDAAPEVKYGTEDYYKEFHSDSSWYVRVLGKDGSELSSAKLPIREEDNFGFYYTILDLENNVLVTCDDGLIAYKDNGEEAYRIPVDGYVYTMATLKDGRTAALVLDYTTYTLKLMIVDVKTGTFTDESYPMSHDISTLISGGGAYDLYYNSGTNFYGFTLESGEFSKVFNWMDCDLSAGNLNNISVRPDGSVRAFSYDYNDKTEILTTEVISVKKVPWTAAREKQHLTLATLYSQDQLLDQVIHFNRTHDDVRIDVVDYYEYNTPDDYSAGYTKLMTEIAAGTVPDLIDISVDMPYIQFASKGILEDLYPYLDKDEELSREDFFPNVMEALTVNDGLYMTCGSFAVYTAVGAASVVGEGPGITYQKYHEALASMPEGCEGFDAGTSRETMTQLSLCLELVDYVNWSTGECNFDSPNFIELLNYLKTFQPEKKTDGMEYTAEDSAANRIAEGKQMMTMAFFTSVDYMLTGYDSMFGGQASIVGFPTNHGVGNMITIISGLGMSAKCPNKDAAWEFIRTYLTEDYQEDAYYIPTNINVFNERLEEAMVPEYETDANGNYLLDENGERIPKSLGTSYDGVNEYEVYSMSAEQGEMLKKAIAESTRLLNFDQSLSDLVSEGAQAFFAGQKSAEETAKLIQSKARIYVNEQR